MRTYPCLTEQLSPLSDAKRTLQSRRRVTAVLAIWLVGGLAVRALGPNLSVAEYYLGDAWLWAFAIPVLLLASLHAKRTLGMVLAITVAIPCALLHVVQGCRTSGLHLVRLAPLLGLRMGR